MTKDCIKITIYLITEHITNTCIENMEDSYNYFKLPQISFPEEYGLYIKFCTWLELTVTIDYGYFLVVQK